jgi:hypothetical protein
LPELRGSVIIFAMNESPKAARRRPDIVLIAAVLALAAIAFFLVRGGGRPSPWPPSIPGQSLSAPLETTFRNVTDETVRYSVRNSRSSARTEDRSLEPGALDRLATDRHLEVVYHAGDKELFFVASPGKPYSFRYDENHQLRIYPGSHSREDAVDLAPYVQTPMPVVKRMLELAGIGPADVLYDIGSGDGRIVIAAAKTYGTRGVGIEINPDLVEESAAKAGEEGVAGLVRFVGIDATKADLSEATVVTLYLLPESNELLKAKLENELRPGSRVVSHNYSFRGWGDRLIAAEKVEDEKGKEHTVLVYRKEAP